MRTAIKMLVYSSAVILGLGLLIWTQMGHRIHNISFGSRVAAAIFLLCVITNFVAEFGYLGGDKTKTSHL